MIQLEPLYFLDAKPDLGSIFGSSSHIKLMDEIWTPLEEDVSLEPILFESMMENL